MRLPGNPRDGNPGTGAPLPPGLQSLTVNTIGFNVSAEAQWFEALCRIATTDQGCATAGDADQLRSIMEGFYRPRSS